MSEGMERVGVEMVARGSDAFFRAMERGDRAVSTFGKGIDTVGKSASKAFSEMATGATRRIGEHLADSFINAGAAVGRFIGGSLDAAATFEKTMNRFSSVAGSSLQESGKSVADFDKLFMQLGADTQYSAQQAGDAAIELAKGGRSAAQVFDELGDSLALASAGEVDLAKAAELSAKQLAIWEDQGVDSAEVADLLAQAANASTVGVDDLGIGLANVGGVAKVAGLSFEETVQALAQLAPGFSSASDAGTSFKAFLNNVQPTTKPAIAAMKELGLYTDETGSAFYDAQGNFVGMEKASELLHIATKDLTQAQRAQALETIFGSDAQRAAAIIAEDGAKGYLAMGEAMGKAGSATDQANEKNKGYAFQLETMRGSLETFQIVLGKLLIGPATEFIQFLTDAVNGLTTLVSAVSGSSDAVDESAESHSSLAQILNVLPFGQAAATAMEYRHQQRLLVEESERLGTVIGQTVNKGFGVMSQHLATATARLRETKIATGELGAAGKLTAEELEKLSKELVKIEEEGTAAAQDAVMTQAGYLIESRDRRKEHLDTLRELNAEYNAATTDQERDGIAAQIAEQVKGHNESQLQADIAYAKQSAAQQAHLGELLVNWVNTQVAMGAITSEQGTLINDTIAQKFGLAADNTSLLFGKMTGSIEDWAATGTGSVGDMVGGLFGMQTEAAKTQAKIDALTNIAIAGLDQKLKDGTITVEEYQARLREIPAEVRTQVQSNLADANREALAVDRALRSLPPVTNVRVNIEERIRQIDETNEEAARQHGAPARHTGGRVWPDQAFVVGERGPEVFVPERAGRILNQQQIAQVATPQQIATSYSTSYTHAPTVNLSPTYHNTPPRPDRDSAQAAALANIL